MISAIAAFLLLAEITSANPLVGNVQDEDFVCINGACAVRCRDGLWYNWINPTSNLCANAIEKMKAKGYGRIKDTAP